MNFLKMSVICGFWISCALQAAVSRPTSFSAVQKGPFPVNVAEYRLPSQVDPEILDDRQTEIWARVYWPKTQSVGRLPVLFLLHGNHGTCGFGKNPRQDTSCQYTNSGTCPAGYVVTPNHEGYAYVAGPLASQGFVVVSINANRGITCGGGASGDYGLNLARGRLILKHMSLWHEWNSKGGAPASLGMGPMGFVNKLDFSRVGIMGHSRGGEGARAALNQYFDPKSIWAVKMPDLTIRAIIEIGAVDGQTSRVLDAPGVAWNQILPLCDGDVSDLEGRAPLERMRATGNPLDKFPKSLNYVWGANHNFFNSEWQVSDSSFCTNHTGLFPPSGGSPEQQLFAQQAISSFFMAHLGPPSMAAFQYFFDPYFFVPEFLGKVIPANRDFYPSVAGNDVYTVENFSQPAGTSTSGHPMVIKNLAVQHIKSYDPNYGLITWKPTQSQVEGSLQTVIDPKGVDVSALSSLDFRIQILAASSLSAMGLTAQLVGPTGELSLPALVWDYGKITFEGHSSVINFETIRIPFRDFAGFNLKAVAGIRFAFTAKNFSTNSIALADVHFSRNAPPASVESQNLSRMVWGYAHAHPASARAWAPPQIVQVLPGAVIGQRFSQESETQHSLAGAKKIILTIQSGRGSFPISDDLPLLTIGTTSFAGGAIGGQNGRSDQMSFPIPAATYQRLVNGSSVKLYNRFSGATVVWDLGKFVKQN